MIQINDKIRIVRLDKFCLEVQELCNVTSKTTNEIRQEWKGKGYYGDLKSAVKGVFKNCAMSLAEEEINGWKLVLQRLNAIENELIEAMKGQKYEI